MKTTHISIHSRKVEYTELIALLQVVQLNCSQINEIFGCNLKTDKSLLTENFLEKEFMRKDGDSKATTYYTLKDSKIGSGNKKYEVIASRYRKGQQLLKFLRTMNERSNSRIILVDPYFLSENCFNTAFVDMNNLSKIEAGMEVHFLSSEKDKIAFKTLREYKILLAESVTVAERIKFLNGRVYYGFPFIFYCDIGEFQGKIYKYYSRESNINEQEFQKLDVIDIIRFAKSNNLCSPNFKDTEEERLKMSKAKLQKIINLANDKKKSSKQTINARSGKMRKTFEVIENKEVF